MVVDTAKYQPIEAEQTERFIEDFEILQRQLNGDF
jgi:hypothetical protein